MLKDTFNSFNNALEFLDIQINDEKLHMAIEASDFKVLKGMENLEGFKEKPMNLKSFFREGQSGIWRQSLIPSQVDALVKRHYDQMKRFKYLPCNHED